MMVVTCPGQRSPETRTSPLASRARKAAGMVLWTQRTEKFSSRCSAARRMARAMAGMVVSKPTPKKTTCLPGSWRASSTASRGA